MKKISIIAVAISFACLSTIALSTTCPRPSEVKYVNGEWVLSQGWRITTDGGIDPANDQISRLGHVEWYYPEDGSKKGYITCYYTWKKVKYPSMVLGRSDFQPYMLQNPRRWTKHNVEGLYTCKAGINVCSFIPA